MERILGTTDLDEMFKKLDAMEDEEDEDFEAEEETARVLDGDLSEFLEVKLSSFQIIILYVL